jgi:hypothetical protein
VDIFAAVSGASPTPTQPYTYADTDRDAYQTVCGAWIGGPVSVSAGGMFAAYDYDDTCVCVEVTLTTFSNDLWQRPKERSSLLHSSDYHAFSSSIFTAVIYNMGGLSGFR